MKNCPNCHSQAKDESRFCPVCGTMLDVVPQPAADYFQPEPQPASIPIPVIVVPSPYDHTKEFSDGDIRENRLSAMAAYLLDFAGIIIGLLMSPTSSYAKFHIRQSLKFTILEVLILLISLLLCWTFIMPILGLAAVVILIVLKLICFVQVCMGQAKDVPILRNMKFLN